MPDPVRSLLPRLENAVSELLFGRPGPLRRRVADAYRDHLVHLRAEQFPEGELRDTFDAIGAAFHAYSDRRFTLAGGEKMGIIDTASHLMPARQTGEVARLIFRLYTLAVDSALSC